jgi:thiol-disulfide isomerase/thioredoxin
MFRWTSAAAAGLSAVALLVTAGPVTAASLPDAGEVLAGVSRAYAGMTTGWFDGGKSVEVVGPQGSRTMSAGFSVALKAPNKFSWEVRDGDVIQQRMACDGVTATLYMPSLGQYVVRPPVTDLDSAGATPDPRGQYFRNPLAAYVTLKSRLRGSRVARLDSLQQGGAWVPCYVVQFDSVGDGPPPALLRRDGGGEMWIDQQRFLVLRELSVVRGDSAHLDQYPEIHMITRFDMVRLDQPLPDSLFTVALPESARKVGWFEQRRPKTPNLSGQPMIDFTLRDLAGKTHRLADYKGKVVMLDFWATWCGPCRREMPIVQKLYQEFKAKGLVVFAVNVREEHDQVAEFLKANKFSLPALLDPEGTVSQQYQAGSIPTLAIIDRKGTISSYFVGVHPEEDLRAALLLAGVGK